MFFTSLTNGIALTYLDPEQERSPPPSPTPVVFQQLPSNGNRSSLSANDLPPLQPLFAKVSKPTHISDEHLEALNVEIDVDCPLEELVPGEHIPSVDLQLDSETTSSADVEPTARYSQRRKAYQERLAELQLDNDTGYRIVTRSLDQSRTAGASLIPQQQTRRPPRLAYMRKFWEGLESMSRYWDCSLDRYYDMSGDLATQGHPKRPRLDTFSATRGNDDTASIPPEVIESDGQGVRESLEHEASATVSRSSRNRDTPENDASPLENDDMAPHHLRRYKGHRTHSGRDMPELLRVDTVKAFVDGTIWPFQCSLVAPRTMPFVQLGKLLLPVKQSASIYRLPSDRAKARAGRLEGPVMTVQIRASFEQEEILDVSMKVRHAAARLDLLRELGNLFLVAQERRREGRTEVKPGEGQWWTSKPRWGGGPGGEAQVEDKRSEIVAVAEEVLNDVKTHKEKKDRKRKTLGFLWKEVKCGSGRWDNKTEYLAMGKNPQSHIDEVYMVSSIYHHISILKLTVHDAYIDYLLSGIKPSPEDYGSGDVEWHRPRLQRSQWFDLFDVQQRIEAFRGLWATMEYLTREGASRRNAPSDGVS